MFYCSTNYSENSVYADYTTQNSACQEIEKEGLTPLLDTPNEAGGRGIIPQLESFKR